MLAIETGKKYYRGMCESKTKCRKKKRQNNVNKCKTKHNTLVAFIKCSLSTKLIQ